MSNKSAILLFLPHATALENALHVSYLDHYNILLMGLFVFNFVQQQNFMHTYVKRILINEHPIVALHCLKSLNVSSSHISFDRNFRICLHHIINQFSSLPHIHSALPYFLYAIIFLNMHDPNSMFTQNYLFLLKYPLTLKSNPDFSYSFYSFKTQNRCDFSQVAFLQIFWVPSLSLYGTITTPQPMIAVTSSCVGSLPISANAYKHILTHTCPTHIATDTQTYTREK